MSTRPSHASTRRSSRASIVNVAAIAKVSTATVSRVLSGKRTKDDDIARRVRAAADKLDYSANAAAAALRSNKNNVIGLAAPSANDPFAAQLIDMLGPVIDAAGRQLSIGISGTPNQLGRRIDALAARHVGGLIVVSSPGADLAGALDRHAARTPIVRIGGCHQPFLTSTVTLDHDEAMAVALRHLVATGVRSVAYLPGIGGAYDSAVLAASFHAQARAFGLDECATQGHEIDGDGCVSGGANEDDVSSEAAIRRGFDHVMTMYGEGTGPRPQALLCHDDAVALGAMHALNMLGLRVPQDVSIISYGDSQLATAAMPQLTSIHPPMRQIVAEAMRLLEVKTESPVHVSLPSCLVIRESTTAPAATSAKPTSAKPGILPQTCEPAA